MTEKLLSSLIEEGVCSRDSSDELDDLDELTSPKKHEVYLLCNTILTNIITVFIFPIKKYIAI